MTPTDAQSYHVGHLRYWANNTEENEDFVGCLNWAADEIERLTAAAVEVEMAKKRPGYDGSRTHVTAAARVGPSHLEVAAAAVVCEYNHPASGDGALWDKIHALEEALTAAAAIRKPQDAYSDKQWDAVYQEIVKEADGLRVEVERLREELRRATLTN